MVTTRNNTEASQPLLEHQRLPNPVTAAAASPQSARYADEADDSAAATTAEATTPVQLFKQNNMSGNAVLLQAFALTFMALVWSMVLRKMPWNALPLFGYHPLMQSLGLVILSQSILVLQPTSTPSQKATGLTLHQTLNLFLVLPLFTAGAYIMWHLHEQAHTHWISWHGTLGAVVVTLAWCQAALGAASVWGGGVALGGGSRAKSVWKWHRLSGYVLLTLFLLTFTLAVLETTWAKGAASLTHRLFVVAALLGVLAIGASRVRTSKLPALRRRRVPS